MPDCFARSAFDTLCLPWRDDMLRFANRLTRDQREAEDIVQITMLRALQGWSTFRPRGDLTQSVRAWLFRITMNAFTDVYRARRYRLTEDVQSKLKEAMYPEAEVFDDLGDECLDALDRLEPCYREVIERAARGEHYSAMAESLGVPIGTVMSRLYRARQQLKELLWEYAQAEYGIGDATRVLRAVGG